MPDAFSNFRALFGRDPFFAARAPGRVNLIGEHTDYNGGFVFPAAVDLETLVLASPSGTGRSRWVSRESGEITFSAARIGRQEPTGWARYGAAMMEALDERRDLDLYVESTIPMGSGLSSSAAIEMAIGRVLLAAAGREMSPVDLALAGQRGENEFVGVACGIMDQIASSAARAGAAMFLDARSLEMEHVPLPPDLAIVVLDTQTPRTLAGSAYNRRRAECESAASLLGARQLRDVASPELDAARDRFDPVLFRRARHVVSENDRATRFREALGRGDSVLLGALMRESHDSLRDDYEVSSPALDAMRDAATATGCVGVRMTGAGFGGCCVALVRTGAAEAFAEETLARYGRTGRSQGRAHVCRAATGAELLEVP